MVTETRFFILCIFLMVVKQTLGAWLHLLGWSVWCYQSVRNWKRKQMCVRCFCHVFFPSNLLIKIITLKSQSQKWYFLIFHSLTHTHTYWNTYGALIYRCLIKAKPWGACPDWPRHSRTHTYTFTDVFLNFKDTAQIYLNY